MQNLADPDPVRRAWAARMILGQLGAQVGAPWVLIGHTLRPGTSWADGRIEGALSGPCALPLSAKAARDWAGYHVEYLGLLVDIPRYGWPDLSRAENLWICGDQAVNLWVRRATHEGSRLYAELVTAPGRRRGGAIRGLELEPGSPDALDRAVRGWRILARLERAGGRPPGGELDHIDPQDFRRHYWALADQYREEGLPRPTQLEFAGELNVSEHTVRRYRTARTIPWPPERR